MRNISKQIGRKFINKVFQLIRLDIVKLTESFALLLVVVLVVIVVDLRSPDDEPIGHTKSLHSSPPLVLFFRFKENCDFFGVCNIE